MSIWKYFSIYFLNMEQEQVKVRQVSSFPFFDNGFIKSLMVERHPDVWMNGLLGILKKELSYIV